MTAMTVIGLGADERTLLQNLDFSGDLSLEFWMFLEKHPAQWHDIFSVRTDDRNNSVSMQLRRRRLRISHGTGKEHVVIFEQDLHLKHLPLNTWLRVSLRREVSEEAMSVEVSISGGRAAFQERAELAAGAGLPYAFPPEERPAVTLLSDSDHLGLVSGFRFQGAEGLYVAYEQGRVVSNAAVNVPLKHEITRVNRGTENEGVFIHSLRSLSEPQFQLMEKKTVKPLEIELVRFLEEHQDQEAMIQRIFPRIFWTSHQGEVLTYMMEFIPGARDRRRSNILEVFDLILGNLRDLAQLGKSYGMPSVLPDTMGEFDAFLPQLFDHDDFRTVRGRLKTYAGIRCRLAQGRRVVSHNDVWGANIAVPLGGSCSRLIDVGRVSENYIGADLLHFRRHYGEDQELWADLVRRYAVAFDADPAEVELGALAYAVQREIENQLRVRKRGLHPRTARVGSLLTELNAKAEEHLPVTLPTSH